MTFPPDSHSTTDFSGRLDAFESKFRNGETPLLEQHLPEPGPNQEPHILQLALIDLEMRLRRGENLSAKSYLDRFPNLTNLGKPLLELIQTEVHWKERRGETIDAELLTRQFPSLAGEILAFLRFRGTLPPEIPGFRNLELVGKGGMGVVYKAMETRLNRDVALKVIRPDRATDPDSLELFQQRFQIEAEKMAAVNHPHVIQVFHAGKVGPQVYLAMEYVAGETLQAKIKRDGTLPFREAAGIVEKIALGVAAVHVTGTIHRDLKPDNVLISTKGIPKVADFGLARQIEPTNGATQEGIFRGTPEYASPEQASMGALDLTERTDVYGLGAILYACLTGRAPFPSDSLPLVLRKVLKDSVIPINSLRPDCPRDLETICNKCLEKESVRRYSSALELAEDLRRHLDGRPIEARPVGSIEKTWLWAKRNQALAASLSVIAAVLVGSAIGFASLSLWALKEKDRANDETTRATNNEALAKTNAETANKNYQEAEKEKKRAQDQRTIAEDNAYISSIQQAKAEWDHGDPSVAQTTLGLIPFAKRGWEHHFLTTLFRSNHANLWHQDERRCVCFSPDRIHLASGGADGSIKLWNMKTGMELLILAHSQPISGLSFSPDGKFLASSSFDQTIRLVDPFNGQEISVLKHAAPVLSFSFGKDGKQLASSSLDQSLTLWSLPQGKSIRQFKSQSGPIRSIEISPNGKYLAGAGQDSTLKLWDLETSKEIRTLKGHTKEVACVTFHPEGNTLASASEDHTVKLWDVNSGSMLLNISGHSAPVNGLKFSPDGMWLASASQDLTLKVWDRRSGQERRTFKGHTEQVHAVAFHPTGTILASASQDQTVKVWDFTSQSDLLHWKGHSREIQCVRYSPDGKWLASASRDGLVKIWDTTKGQVIRALKGHTGPVVSTTFFPDGNRLASSSDDNTVKIWDVSRGTVIKRSQATPKWFTG